MVIDRRNENEMIKVFHYKLIRDNAPNKMREAGVKFEMRQLEEKEFKNEFLRKVIEEAGELGASTTKEEITGELADVLDVIDQVQGMFGITDNELQMARADNTKEKGGFRERCFLEWSETEAVR
jgi:predicted house-cleaning noncanonical NTP pyrophosphatase (MazG superfamily)